MAKKERNITRERTLAQMGNIASITGETTGYLKGRQPGYEERARESQELARGAATGLYSGEMNPYATSLAVTGGISEDEAQRMETSATRGVRSVYDVAEAEAKRKQAITGGYGGGGETAQIARRGGQAAAETLTDVGARIAGARQTGRISGAGMVGQQQMAGAELLASQYGLDQNQANIVMNQIIEAQRQGIELSQGDLRILAELARQPGGALAGLQAAGQVASGVGGLIGGIRGTP